MQAIDSTTVAVTLHDASSPASVAALATANLDFLTFSRLTASTSTSRDTQGDGEGSAAGGPATRSPRPAGLRVSTRRATAPSRARSPRTTSGAAANPATKDDAVAKVDSARVKAKKLAVTALSDTTYTATAKDATNDVTGDTKATVLDANLYDIGTDGLAVDARDDSTLTALATQMVTIAETPFVSLANGRARNDVDRGDTEAAVDGKRTSSPTAT